MPPLSSATLRIWQVNRLESVMAPKDPGSSPDQWANSGKIRAKALAPIAEAPQLEDLPTLFAALQDPSDRVRKWAIEGLKNLVKAEPTVLGSVRQALERRLREDDSKVIRQRAAEALEFVKSFTMEARGLQALRLPPALGGEGYFLCIRKGPPPPTVEPAKPAATTKRIRPRKDKPKRPPSIAQEIGWESASPQEEAATGEGSEAAEDRPAEAGSSRRA